MGLLTQALAGAVGAAGDTGAALMTKNYEAGLQAERDKAQALRDQNLENLRAQNTQKAADTAFGRIGAAREAEQMGSLSPTMVDGNYATNAGVNQANADNTNIQKKIGLISTGVDPHDFFNALTGDVNADAEAIKTLKDSASDDAQPQIDDLNSQMHAFTNPSRELVEEKMKATEALWANKYEQLRQMSEDRNASTTERANSKLQMAEIIARLGIEAKKTAADSPKAMTKGQAASVASRLLKKKSDSPDGLDDDEQALLDVSMQTATGNPAKGKPLDALVGDGVQMTAPPKTGLIATPRPAQPARKPAGPVDLSPAAKKILGKY